MFAARTALLITAFGLAAVPALAQNPIPAPTLAVSESERAAATYLVQDSVGDVQLGKLALQKSQNSAVRAFAQTLVSDHTRTFEEGRQAARAVGAEDAKMEPSDEAQIDLGALSKYSGREFDREFLTGEIASHENDIKTIRDAMGFTTNPTLKQTEENALRIDEKHLRLANEALDQLERQS